MAYHIPSIYMYHKVVKKKVSILAQERRRECHIECHYHFTLQIDYLRFIFITAKAKVKATSLRMG